MHNLLDGVLLFCFFNSQGSKLIMAVSIMMKTKAIVISIFCIVAMGLVLLIIKTMPENDTAGKEVTLRADIKEGYTMEDMIANIPEGKNKNNADDSYVHPGQTETERDEELSRIQAIIQENERSVASSAEEIAHPAGRQDSGSASHPVQTKTVLPKGPSLSEDTVSVTAEEPLPTKKRRGFNSIRLVKESETNAIRAFVHSTQTVMVGSTLKMQLSENCLTDDGRRIKKGTPVYGEVSAIDGERVMVKITSININNNILPFKKEVYSRDALEGIYVPGNAKSETAQDASAAAIQGAQTNITGGFDVGTQLVAGAANSVINATKSVATKNIRKIKVTIKTNYQVLLMEEKR